MCAFALAQRGNWTRSVVLLSREDSTTKAFTLVNVYDCPIASWNCRSLSLGAKYSDVVRRRGKSRPMLFQRHFAFYYQRYQSNASAEYFRSYEMRVQTRSWGWDLFYLLANLFTHIFSLSLSLSLSLSFARAHISFDKRHWILSFFPFFRIYPCSRSCSLLCLYFLSLRFSQSFFAPFTVSTCWWTFPPFHLLICTPFSSVRCSFSFCCYLCRLARLLDTMMVSFSFEICSLLFRKVTCTSYPTWE